MVAGAAKIDAGPSLFVDGLDDGDTIERKISYGRAPRAGLATGSREISIERDRQKIDEVRRALGAHGALRRRGGTLAHSTRISRCFQVGVIGRNRLCGN